MRSAALVIPCFDEADRFRGELVEEMVASGEICVVLVDDGSRDATGEVLRSLASKHPEAIIALATPKNVGKGEAVRFGLSHALEQGASIVGYADADFSTPPDELTRLYRILVDGPYDAILGLRLVRMGADIQRRMSRHFLGRVFATAAALTLDAPIYDSQCGAKWFRVNGALRHSLARPFETRWAFDVELLGRLLGRFDRGPETLSPERILEEPLAKWHDVPGSKVTVSGMAASALAIVSLWSKASK